MLLLERRADPAMEWWSEAFGRGGRHALAVQPLLDPAEGPYVLPRLPPEHRRKVFNATLKEIGQDPEESPSLDRRLAELSWGGEPLFLMMSALMSARTSLREVLSLTPAEIVFRIAQDFELERIRKIAESRRIDPDFLAHMAAYVTLCQGLSRSQAEEAVAEEKRALRYDSVGDPPRIYEALYDALPGEGDNLAPVLPDLLGEAVTVLALGDGDSQKAEEAVARAAGVGGDRVVSAVVRTADDFGSVRNEVLGWLTRLVKEGGENDDAIVRIVEELPQETLALREAAAELTLALVERFRQKEQTEPLAAVLNNLSIRLSDVGRREEALEAGQEAVSIRRDLASARPEAFRPALASALNNLANLLSAVGRREEALEAGQEAVSQYRDFASARPEAFRPDLAMSLNNLATLLSDVGRREEALEAGQEAVSIRRDLASARPEAFRPALAVSLFNLSFELSDAGQYDQAIKASKEAVGLLVPFFLALPAAFGDWMAKIVRQYLHLIEETGRQPDPDLLAPLVEAGFLKIEPENPASPDEVSPDPEEDPR
jgi:tetratricopeptide (TPR) repeat protein